MISQIISENEQRVKDALDTWAEWQRDYHHNLGYGHVIGFSSGSSMSEWEDFERKVERNMAVNMQAIIDGLDHLQQSAINHFHLSAVWSSKRVAIEEVYQEALIIIEVALRRRGLI